MTDEDGRFVIADLPRGSVTVIVKAEGYKRRQVTLPTTTDPDAWAAIELRQAQEERRQRILVKGLAVHIAEELYLELESTGEQLTVKQYIERSRAELLKSAPDHNELLRAWIDRTKREKLLEALAARGIHPEALAALLNRMDADELDLLASVAFGAPIRSRDERAEALRNRDSAFLARFNSERRRVMEALLDHYRRGGLQDVERGEVFRLPPFDEMGGAVGVARAFSGPEHLRDAIQELVTHLYEGEAA